ncbi:PH domain-containing protein [Microbacterium amylolyticum]|uniref:Membrane protein YdbS with pleckstrin-like domain n=1 Tax=Microbacterium amylolyticum TaxID=936337 RepID=A0ABS4ZJU5_9MICO|nr:PH domain-containing protein [Microbacterium amylolyticum]MBP2437556.1 membrane protein YdbS with pleckstrin-like domain [Microbacterium amylolyticum]
MAEEQIIARFRSSGRKLMWSALLLIAVSGATGYFWSALPSPFEDWMLLAAAGAVVLFFVVVPWWAWAQRRYIVTTRRVVVSRGILIRRRSELLHAAGYGIDVRRGPLQRISGTGTIVLSGAGGTLELRNVPGPGVVRETLADQVEVGRILAHREAQQQAADPYFSAGEIMDR